MYLNGNLVLGESLLCTLMGTLYLEKACYVPLWGPCTWRKPVMYLNGDFVLGESQLCSLMETLYLEKACYVP